MALTSVTLTQEPKCQQFATEVKRRSTKPAMFIHTERNDTYMYTYEKKTQF